MTRLRHAPPYRVRPHDILTVSTQRLLAAHASEVELSPLNSGAGHPAANYLRGAQTFQPIARYPWPKRVAVSPGEPVVELTVRYVVADIGSLVTDVRTL